jgi:hypothetical protein
MHSARACVWIPVLGAHDPLSPRVKAIEAAAGPRSAYVDGPPKETERPSRQAGDAVREAAGGGRAVRSGGRRARSAREPSGPGGRRGLTGGRGGARGPGRAGPRYALAR